MPFIDYINLLPQESNEKTRSRIKRLLDGLDNSIRKLKIKCGMCKVDRGMFKRNREKLVAKLKKRFPNSMVLLKGNESIVTPCSKTCFHQDSYFYWAFGVDKPSLWGAIDVETETSYIFYDCHVKGNKNSYPHSEHIVKKYKIDKVMPYADMKYEITKPGRNIFLVMSNMDEKRFSEMGHEGIVKTLSGCGSWMCNTALTPVFIECRMVKSSTEQYIMAVAAKLNSDGMVFVIRNMKPGMAGYCAGALFDFYIKSNANCVSKARPLSCLTGRRIFCVDRDRSTFFLKDDLESGDLCILDMGVALRNYWTNLIATVPVNGTFSDSQAVVYNIVLRIRSALLGELKPGITFGHLANIAKKTMVNQMIQYFLLEGTIDDIMESGICQLFVPHGLGHFLGLDFYDCDEEVDIHSTKRIRGNIEHLVAKEGMVLALNSELYIDKVMIKKWVNTASGVHLQSQYLPRYFGLAARIQDVVLITSHSLELLSNVPRTIKQIQKTMLEKVDVPFIKCLRPLSPSKDSMSKNSYLEKFSVNERKGIDYLYPENKNRESLLHLRSKNEDKLSRKRMDLEKLLNTIKKSREWKPMERLNQIMEEVYAYPFKIHTMLELIMIPLIPQRRRPSFVPHPEVSPIIKSKIELPKSGYGCPYFKWNESIASFMPIQDKCSQTQV